MKIGIIREGKNLPDRRAPLSPRQCQTLMVQYPDLDIWVQPSPHRAYSDEMYQNAGISLHENLSPCDVLMGVKEVPIDALIPGKTYFFFSHTIKKQSYNRHLLRAILDKKIKLIDYELLKDSKGRRLVGFGRYAGIVGAYNAFLAYGKKSNAYDLKPAHLCTGRSEVERELGKIRLPKNYKIVITGEGRVAGGIIEILERAGIQAVEPGEFLNHGFEHPVYTQLSALEYNRRIDGAPTSKKEFYTRPELFESDFMRYAQTADLYISGHFWDNKSPLIITAVEAADPSFKIGNIADVSCDIAGPIASTLRASTIANPLYGYDRQTGQEADFLSAGTIGVMAVDNLPCELPLDASEDFGSELITHLFPELLKPEVSVMLQEASETTFEGSLSPRFAYLADYVA